MALFKTLLTSVLISLLVAVPSRAEKNKPSVKGLATFNSIVGPVVFPTVRALEVPIEFSSDTASDGRKLVERLFRSLDLKRVAFEESVPGTLLHATTAKRYMEGLTGIMFAILYYNKSQIEEMKRLSYSSQRAEIYRWMAREWNDWQYTFSQLIRIQNESGIGTQGMLHPDALKKVESSKILKENVEALFLSQAIVYLHIKQQQLTYVAGRVDGYSRQILFHERMRSELDNAIKTFKDWLLVLDRLELLPKSKKSNVTRRFQMMIDDLSSIQD